VTPHVFEQRPALAASAPIRIRKMPGEEAGTGGAEREEQDTTHGEGSRQPS
jgi:hypothetical protein